MASFNVWFHDAPGLISTSSHRTLLTAVPWLYIFSFGTSKHLNQSDCGPLFPGLLRCFPASGLWANLDGVSALQAGQH